MEPIRFPRFSIAFSIACGLLLQSCTTLHHVGVANSAPVEFHAAVAQVVDALRYYQTHLQSQTGKRLPSIKEAEFNFKIATGKEVGLDAGPLYVFTLGGSAESTTSHEITYTYKGLPSPQNKPSSDKPALLSELIDTIQTVAAAVEESKAFGKKPYQSMKVQVEFGFKLHREIEAEVPIQLITIGAHAHYDKSTVQTVTLTFAGAG
jgi:hypothetical protein